MKKISPSIVLIACLSGLSLTSFQKDSSPTDLMPTAGDQSACIFYQNTFYTTTAGTSVFEESMGYYPDCLFDWPYIRIQKSTKPSLSSVKVYFNDVQWISNKFFSGDHAGRFINIPYGTEIFIKVEMTGKAGAWINLSISSGPKDENPCDCPQ